VGNIATAVKAGTAEIDVWIDAAITTARVTMAALSGAIGNALMKGIETEGDPEVGHQPEIMSPPVTRSSRTRVPVSLRSIYQLTSMTAAKRRDYASVVDEQDTVQENAKRRPKLSQSKRQG
jgi:hypothetical protein